VARPYRGSRGSLTDLTCPPQSLSISPPSRCSFLISSSSPRRFASAAPAAADSTQHRYRSCRLILSPAHVLLLHSSTLCVCTCVIAIQHPALGGCSACNGRYRRPLARPEPLSGLIAQLSLVCVIPHAMLVHLSVLITPMPRRSKRRDAKTSSYTPP
jgi:hypothetical protein